MSRLNHHASDEEIDAAIKKDWNEFWLPLFREAGATPPPYPSEMQQRFINQVKKELYDIHALTDHLTETYMHFSGGAISKPMTLPSEVISIAEERENEDRRDDLSEFIEHIEAAVDGMVDPALIIQSLRAWFSIPVPSESEYAEVPEDPFIMKKEN